MYPVSIVSVLARTYLVGLILLCTGTALAIDPMGFEDPGKQAQYQMLLEELRCLVCQNESLASSSAGLASDLRREVHRLVAEGRATDDIKDYLVDRYGEFVLYRPRVTAATWLLWFGPLLLIVTAIIAALITIRRRAPVTGTAELSASEQQRLSELLSRDSEKRENDD